ncbi:MAG: hypothetical protein ACYC3F_02540 [Gemmatimonadaceae bacterium]
MTTLSMNRRTRYGRRFVGGLCAAALSLQMGCYTYQPLQTSVPATGSRIAVVLNDRGRSMLGDRLGSAIDKVDGLLVEGDGANVTFEVYRTIDLRGTAATWTGERVQLPKDGITGYQGRQFSKRRTFLLVGTAVAVIVTTALAVNFDLFGGFTRDDPGSGGPTGDSR